MVGEFLARGDIFLLAFACVGVAVLAVDVAVGIWRKK